MLVVLKRHGLETPSLLAIGDGELGFWAALRIVFPETRVQPKTKADNHYIWMSDIRAASDKALENLPGKNGRK